MAKLEDEIGRKKFDSNIEKAVINILHTANWLNKQKRAAMQEYDLLPQHFSVLDALANVYPSPLTLQGITQAIPEKSADVKRLIDKMVELGYVNRQKTRGNMRQRDISLSDSGYEIYVKVNRKLQEHQNILGNRLFEMDVIQLNTFLDLLRG